jgi:antitoxin (DNA-binding transcriptional repressor) of toxin-antitoxin stability system
MTTISIQQAQAKRSDLIHELTPGEEVLITENSQPVARLVKEAVQVESRRARKLGTLKGNVLQMAPDFDAPLDDFKEYTE